MDLDWDGSVDLTDLGNFSALIGGTPWSSPEYIADADLDANGVVNSKDWGFRKTRDKTPWGAGEYSRRGNTIGYAGSVYDPAAGLWLMRHRWLDPRVGRWLTRDPAGYVDGMSLHGYVGQGAWTAIDQWGAWGIDWHHLYPQKFAEHFTKIFAHLNAEPSAFINTASQGRLVPRGPHRRAALAYNRAWRAYFAPFLEKKTLPSAFETMAAMHRINQMPEFARVNRLSVMGHWSYSQWSRSYGLQRQLNLMGSRMGLKSRAYRTLMKEGSLVCVVTKGGKRVVARLVPSVGTLWLISDAYAIGDSLIGTAKIYGDARIDELEESVVRARVGALQSGDGDTVSGRPDPDAIHDAELRDILRRP